MKVNDNQAEVIGEMKRRGLWSLFEANDDKNCQMLVGEREIFYRQHKQKRPAANFVMWIQYDEVGEDALIAYGVQQIHKQWNRRANECEVTQ